MTVYTQEAIVRLDEYLIEVRSAITGRSSMNPDEVEQDVRDHVAAALEPANQPITVDQLESVIERLGPPEQWVADSHRTIWKYLADTLKPVGHRALDQIRAIPGEAYVAGRSIVTKVRDMKDDWRLAYLAFGLFAMGMIVFPLFPAFLIASYIVARTEMAIIRERNTPMGARRWFVYPPLLLVSSCLIIALASWPISVGVALTHEIPHSLHGVLGGVMHVSSKVVQPVAATYLAIGAVSIWWMFASLVVIRYPKLPAVLFPPFGSKFGRLEGLLVFLLSATASVVWLSFADTAWQAAKLVVEQP